MDNCTGGPVQSRYANRGPPGVVRQPTPARTRINTFEEVVGGTGKRREGSGGGAELEG